MGLLYISGVRLHDDDQDDIEAARERRRPYFPPASRKDAAEQRYTQRESMRSLSTVATAATRPDEQPTQ